MPRPEILAYLAAPATPAVHLLSIGWADLVSDGWELRGAASGFWTVYLNDRDGAEMRFPDRTVALPAGRPVLVPPGSRFDGHCRTALRHLFIYLDLPGLPRHRLDGLDRPVVLDPDDGSLAALAAAPGTMPDPAGRLRLTAWITGQLARHLPAELWTDRGDPRLAPALARIDADPARVHANPDLAAVCGLSVDAFVRRFRAACGTTPAQAVRERRVQLAARLLLTGDLPLDEVARRCGFGSRPYLSRVFAAVLGVGPADYRRGRARAAVIPLGGGGLRLHRTRIRRSVPPLARAP